MTREHKLALIVGFSLVLVLGVLISDHFSKARKQDLAEDIRPTSARQIGANVPGIRMQEEQPTGGLMPLPDAGGARFMPTTTASAPQPQMAPATGPDVRPVPQGEVVMGRPTTLDNAGLGARRADTTALAQLDRTPAAALPSQNTSVPGVPSPTAMPTVPVTTPAPVIPVQRHEVKDGDTLYRIAVKYYGDGKLWEKVREYNKDRVSSSGDLRVGATLQIPPKDVLLGKPYIAPTTQTTPAATPATTPAMGPNGKPLKPETRIADADNKNFKEYVVKEGDTLSVVAKKTLGSSKRWPELVDANKGVLSDPESLKVGMKLRVPTTSSNSGTTR